MKRLRFDSEPLRLRGLAVNAHCSTLVNHPPAPWGRWLKKLKNLLVREWPWRRRQVATTASFQAVDLPSGWGLITRRGF